MPCVGDLPDFLIRLLNLHPDLCNAAFWHEVLYKWNRNRTKLELRRQGPFLPLVERVVSGASIAWRQACHKICVHWVSATFELGPCQGLKIARSMVWEGCVCYYNSPGCNVASDSNEINICTAVPGSPAVPLEPKWGHLERQMLRSDEIETWETRKTRHVRKTKHKNTKLSPSPTNQQQLKSNN